MHNIYAKNKIFQICISNEMLMMAKKTEKKKKEKYAVM